MNQSINQSIKEVPKHSNTCNIPVNKVSSDERLNCSSNEIYISKDGLTLKFYLSVKTYVLLFNEALTWRRLSNDFPPKFTSRTRSVPYGNGSVERVQYTIYIKYNLYLENIIYILQS
jgi:hypothetical protein